ncbi:MAG: hypothetical protein ACOCZL_04595 [Bacteroidota bacterium]
MSVTEEKTGLSELVDGNIIDGVKAFRIIMKNYMTIKMIRRSIIIWLMTLNISLSYKK